MTRVYADETGFSLVELVVAMAIMAIILVGLVQAVRGSLVNIGTAGRTAEAAQVLAQQWAILERAGIVPGEDAGELDGGWNWRYTAQAAADPRFLHVSLQLSWIEASTERHVSLDALTLAPAEE